MDRLEQYLTANWPVLVDECDSYNTEDIAIHVMRSLDEQLGGKDIEIARLRDLVSTKIEQVEFLNRSLLDECKRLNAEVERLRR